MAEADVLWQLIKDNFEQARAHETYRADISKLVITLAGILVGTLSVTGVTPRGEKVVWLAVGVLGIYGALASAKHYERNRMHVATAQHLLDKLKDLAGFQSDLNKVFKDFQSARNWKHSPLASLSLNWLWTGFPGLLGAAALLTWLWKLTCG
ncbi:MAG TPA: hypothetical protein VGL70_15490 [Candidatus Binatia bacterium]|jgi:hypothetical protein